MPVNSFENYPMTWKPNLTNKKGPLYKALSNLLDANFNRFNNTIKKCKCSTSII